MNRDNLQALAQLRIEEAKTLLDNKKWSGTYYLSGYCIECALKACIAKQTKEFDFPDKAIVNDSYTHDLNKLMKTSGLLSDFEKARKQNTDLDVNWNIVKEWSENDRYKTKTEEEAKTIYNAITDSGNGVLSWISKYW